MKTDFMLTEIYQEKTLETFAILKSVLQEHYRSERKKSNWAVIYKLHPIKKDGRWFVLLGDDFETGIVASGDTPEEAISNFDKAMNCSAGKWEQIDEKKL